jgi:predicted metalloprotease with PDZ domain
MIGRRQLLMGAGALLTASLFAASPSGRSYEEPDDMYEALRRQRGTPLDVAGGRINVVFADDAPGLDRERVLRWVRKSARAMSTYFGTYPTRAYGLLIVSTAGDRIGHATTYGYQGSATRIYVGVDADERAFAEDWILVHEMVHTALPDLPRRTLWVQEGSATWIEPIARAQAGDLAVSEVWREAIDGMPKGMPPAGSGGMDGTHEWGRLYWGGATFWLEAEIAIYRQSGGRFLLCDAMRAVNRQSGGNSVDWAPEKMMAVGDKATGTTALTNLYQKFSSQAFDGRLAELFERLGVAMDSSGSIRFDQGAELATLTRLITLPLHRG